MKKIKHNKKRNTAFLYEALIREMTKAVVSKNESVKKTILNILKESFSPKNILSKELELYRTLLETEKVNPITAEKLLYQVREAHHNLGQEDIYSAQSYVINRVNKELSPNVFNNFVPNYKSIATVSQLFGIDSSAAGIKRGVLLEQTIISNLTSEAEQENINELKPIDNLVYKTFSGKFNEVYSQGLLGEQKELLNRYIFSFADNSVDIKIYLNEELARLHTELDTALLSEHIKTDETMVNSTNSVISMIENFRTQPVDKALIESVLKIQNLVHEIKL
tara:strand:- start:858 stop:1694 length:837 start_codon:yes stop_codon:yes gene_type:complete